MFTGRIFISSASTKLFSLKDKFKIINLLLALLPLLLHNHFLHTPLPSAFEYLI